MNQALKESYLKYKICVICNVPQSQAPGVLYAKFPQNLNRCRKWIRVIGDVKLLQLSLKKIQYRFVCGKHFLPQFFTKSGKHLTKDAIPTIFPHIIKPLKKEVVKLFPPLITRTNNKVLLQCTQRIVPIRKEPMSPDSTSYEYLEDEFLEHMDPEPKVSIKHEVLDVQEPSITIKKEALDACIQDCLPKIIPILHHNLPPNSQTTEIYTINKDRQVIPITTKVLNDGKECIIELSQKRIPIVPKKESKVIPVSNKVLSTIMKKEVAVKIESIGYEDEAYKRSGKVAVKIESIGYAGEAYGKGGITQTSPKNLYTDARDEQMHKKIEKLQRRNRQLKRILRNIMIVDEIESPHIKKAIKKAILYKQLKDGINEFSHNKQLAVSILKRALNAYHYLSCLMPLPNVCMLQKISRGVPSTSNTTKCRHLL